MKMPFTLLLMTMLAAAAGFADPVLMPLPGTTIDGAPGSTIGWGYSLTNDTSDWYLPESVSLPVFADGTPTLLFDFPAVGPGATVTEDYPNGVPGQACAALPCGLLELTFSPTATPGNQDLGDVIVTGEYFDSNPYTNRFALDLGPAPNLEAGIEAVVTSSAVPEPSLTWVLLAICVLGLARLSLRKRPATPTASQ